MNSFRHTLSAMLVLSAATAMAGELCLPENTADGVKLSPTEYAKLIEPHLGVPPIVDCGKSTEMPIYIDGEKFVGDPGLHQCDNPSLQVGDCMSGSSVARYVGSNADGTPRHDVVWASFCRHDGRGDDWGIEIPNSVQMIGYNMQTGATAFFESGDNKPWISADPDTNRLVGTMPGVDDAEAFDHAYATPGDVQCVACHQADPYIHNPFIDGAKLAGSNRPVVPQVAGRKSKANTPYWVIGASNWDMRTIHIEGNECLGCHRIGMKTLEEFIGDHWHPDDHMPPRDPGSLRADFAELRECWINGPENTPGCEWIIPPADNCPSQVVDATYPFAARFNQPREDLLARPTPKTP